MTEKKITKPRKNSKIKAQETSLSAKIDEICNKLYAKSNKKFANDLNISEATLISIRKSDRPFSLRYLFQLLECQPDINLDWLFRNEGGILRSKSTQIREPVASSAPMGDLVSLEKYAALIRENERLRLELEAVKAAASARLDGDGGGMPLFTTFQSTDRT